MIRLREHIEKLMRQARTEERGSLPFAILVSAIVLTISAIVGISIAWQAKAVFKEQSTQEAAWATSNAINIALESLSVIDPKTDPNLTGIPSTLSTTDIPAGVTWTKIGAEGSLFRWWIIRGPNPVKATLQAQGKAGDVIPAEKMVTAQIEYDYTLASWKVVSVKDITTGDFRDPPNLTPGVRNGVNMYLDAAKTQSYPGTGTTWYDLSNNGNNATLVNGPTFNAGFAGGAIVLDGTNDHATVASLPASFWNGASWTSSTWVRFTAVNKGSDNVILSHGTTTTNNGLQLLERNGKIIFSFFGNDITSASTVQAGTWYNIVATYNYGTKAKTLYINGVQDATGGTVGYSGTGTNTRIGASMVPNGWLGGDIANFTLYSKILTPTEIQAGYTANKKTFGYGPVLDFNMSQASYPGTGTTWFDVSGNGNNITLTNGPKYSKNNGGYLQFDGVNDYGITASNVSFGNNTTWEAWINATGKPGVYNVFMGRSLPYFGMFNGNSLIFSNTLSSVQQTYTSPTNLNLGTWYHAVFTTSYDGTNTVERTYVNGVQVATSTFPGVQTNTATKFAVGQDIAQLYPFAGKISTVRVYNYTMPAAEILQLYNGSKSVYSESNSEPVLFYDTASPQSYPGTGTTWFDLTSSENDGTLVNGPTYSSANGTSMNFDGTNDYVAIPTLDESLWANSSWTVNTWVRFNDVNRGVHNTLLSHGVNGTNTAIFLQERAGKPFFGFYGNDITGTTSLQAGTWYNLVFTYNNATKAKSIYVNGALDTTGGTVGYSGTGTNTRIGIGTVLVNDFLSGKIGTVTISDRALTAAEIATSYNSTKLRYENTTSSAPIFTVAADNTKSYPRGENLLLQSDNITVSPWTKIGANVTLTADTAVAPDGTTTADQLTDSGWVSGDSFYQDIPVSGTGTYTMSTYVKGGASGEITVAGYFLGNTTVANSFTYNTITGALSSTSPNLATVTPAGNGWYRISMTVTGGNPLNTTFRWQIYANSGGTTYFWGPQLERSPAVAVDGYLSLPGISGNYASTPDSTKLDITGDLTIMSQVAFPDWTPTASASRIVGKRGGSTGGYELFLRSTGVLEFQWYDSVTAGYRGFQSSIATGIPDGATRWVAATLDANNDAGGFTVRFWTSLDGVTWTQLGIDRTQSVVATIAADTSAVEIGARGASNDLATANFYRAAIARGIGAGGVPGGITVLNADFTSLPAGTINFTSPTTGEYYTIFTSGGTTAQIIPRAPILPVSSNPSSVLDGFVYLPGASGNNIQVADSNEFDINGDIDIQVKLAADDWTPTANQFLVSKRSTSSERSYVFFLRTNATLGFTTTQDGVTDIGTSSTASVIAADGQPKWVRVTRDADNGAGGSTTTYYTSDDGIIWTTLGTAVVTTPATPIYSSTTPVMIGSRANGVSDMAAGEFYRVIIKNGISGPVVYDANMTNLPSISTTSFTVNGATINYAENPGFETNTNSWGGTNSTLSTTVNGVAGGTKALQILPNSTSSDSYAYYTGPQVGTLKEGRTYTISGTITIPIAQTGTVNWGKNQIWVGPYVGAALTGAVAGTAATGTGTTRVSATFTVPTGMTSISIRLYNGYSNSATNVVYWDNIQIEEAATASTYFDGSSTGAYWGGIANNSASYLTTARTATINKSGTAATSNVSVKTQRYTGNGTTTYTPTTANQILRGNLWTNIAATSNNAALAGGATYNPASGGGMLLNGTGNKIDMPTWANLGLAKNFTISYWATVNTNRGTWWSPAIVNETPLTNGFRHGYGTDTNRNLRFWTTQSGGTLDVQTPNNMYTLGVPFLVTLTYDGTKGTIYVNGVQQAQATGTFITPTGTVTYGTGASWTGSEPAATSSIHSMEIYEKVLTATEISLLYSSKQNLYIPNLIVNASFEDGLTSGNTAWVGGGCSGTNLALSKAVPAVTGSSVLEATAITACNSRAYYYANPSLAPYGVAVQPGQTYTFTVSTRAATTPRTFDLPIDFYDAAGNVISSTDPADVLNSTNTWTRSSTTFTVPFGAVAAAPSIRWISVNTGEIHYLDNATLIANQS